MAQLSRPGALPFPPLSRLMARLPSTPLPAAAALLLFLAACGDAGPSGPDPRAPVVAALEPLRASPRSSPAEITLTGTGLADAQLSAPPHLYLEVLSRSREQIRLRAGFRGGPPGPAWIQLVNGHGRDSIAFTIDPLPAGDSLTETRALWVSRFEYASQQDIRNVMAKAQNAGFNLVYLQVRGRADAFYRSAHEPWAANLTGTLGRDPGWDPLGVAVEEGKLRGVEVHAWINAFTGWAGTTPPPESTPRHAFLEHPDWVMVDAAGNAMPYRSDTRWMSPGHPGVRTRMAAVAADIARKYDVGGIHLDFIRYPDPGWSYDGPSLAAWDAAKASEPGLGFDEMRRRFVAMAVAETRDSLRAAAPGSRLSAAVWGIYKNPLGWSGVSTGHASVLQDAREWDRQGIVDALAPMVYWTIKANYGDRLDYAWLADDHARGIGVPVFVGIHVPDLDGPGLARHVERARMAGAEGVAVFSASSLESAALWDALRRWAFHWPARQAGR